eukprot:970999-Alexandrium_andersonii.AAC.1
MHTKQQDHAYGQRYGAQKLSGPSQENTPLNLDDGQPRSQRSFFLPHGVEPLGYWPKHLPTVAKRPTLNTR